MDILKNKQLRNYDYVSRYSNSYYYYNTEDGKYMHGLTNQLRNDTNYVLHRVIPTDNLDYLANYYYGRPDLFWIIADFNRIPDSFVELYPDFKTLKIPSISNLEYKE